MTQSLKHFNNRAALLTLIILAFTASSVGSMKPTKADAYGATIYPWPQNPTINSTLNFTIDIKIRNILAMTEYEVHIDWDPMLLSLTALIPGTFLNNNSQTPTQTFTRQNNTVGTLAIAEAQVPSTYKTAMGTGYLGNATLFSLTFVVNGTGQCTLHLHDINVIDVASIMDTGGEDGYFNNQQVTYTDAGVNYNATVVSNSTAYGLSFNLTAKTLTFNVSGPEGTTGYANITIPKLLMDVDPTHGSGVWVLFLDGVPTTSFTVTSNDTYTFIYLTYAHSDHSIVIQGNKVIPETIPDLHVLILMLMAAAALFMIVQRRKHNTRRHMELV